MAANGAAPPSVVAANPAIAAKSAEIKAAQASLEQTVREIGAVSDRLASLRVHEQQLRSSITQLESEHRTLITVDTNVLKKNIADQLQTDEDQMRALQIQIEEIGTRRDARLQELKAVDTVGHNIGGTAAGEPQSLNQHNLVTGRYDLQADEVTTGLSHDPLAQTPARTKTKHLGNVPHPGEGLAPSINDLGMHASASPYVKPEDYAIEGSRPATAAGSAKFSDWRSPSRSTTRVAQPPGGFSHMSSIFG